MSTPGGWYAQQAKANPDLFRVVFDFNSRPQYWVHPEVMDRLPDAKVVKALAGATHGSAHLAKWLRNILDLNAHEPVWDFEEPRRRLNLLAPETLAKLARFAAAALSWPRIASVIGKVQMQEIKSTFGEDAHSFALRRARFIIPESDAVLPESDKPLYDNAMELGWNLLTSAACDEADPIQQRFVLKLPMAVAERTLRRVPQDIRERAWNRIRKISTEVLTEGETKCFA
ncbi:SctK family type III secretion system sorting platform protein [Brevifollis gellanilyticus]|uniref:Uncharacterized protein n=1 Tax=Brevifollis gellanilyticus TaxID=748831 RepID=A0A512MAH2_9BACT|nr:SctK family type III secretion system sorting platform protein [Brevifollis gellanilyticus]GEP43729.1 hypothetical protein BGE01nite_30200 [Brevifollis gellanilyticus]